MSREKCASVTELWVLGAGFVFGGERNRDKCRLVVVSGAGNEDVTS